MLRRTPDRHTYTPSGYTGWRRRRPCRPPCCYQGTCLPGLRELILALDGKVARPAGDLAAGTRALHMVSACLVQEGLALVQEPCTAKSNQITAISHPLEHLVLDGAVVTIDAAG